MSITFKSPTDYKKRIVLVSQLQRVCLDCGASAALLPDGWTCCACGSHNTGEVWDHDLETFRRGLMEAEEQKARELVAACQQQADELCRGLTAITYLRGDEPAERR